MSAAESSDENKVSETSTPLNPPEAGSDVQMGDTEAAAVAKVTPQQPEQSKICGVCNDQESKYKCSRCALPYCSVACATLHRATHPVVQEDIPSTASEIIASSMSNGMSSETPQGNTTSTGPRNAFTVLEGSRELETLFMVYPRLRSQLRDIYTATQPPTEDTPAIPGHYSENQQFQRGRGRGRGRLGRVRDRGSWNSDRGTQDGIDALCDAKEQYGKAGEGIKEYSELVLKLVAAEGIDVAQLVQQEVAEENAKIIAQLLNGDSY